MKYGRKERGRWTSGGMGLGQGYRYSWPLEGICRAVLFNTNTMLVIVFSQYVTYSFNLYIYLLEWVYC